MHKAKLYLVTSLAVIAVPSTAAAQSPTAASAPAANQPTVGIGDIVVTAQKRSENLQKTPAAVTAVSGEALARSGITDLTSVQVLIPGARFQQEGSSTQVFLRGVGSNLDYANIEPNVSFNANGIFIPREGTGSPLYDIERLEALPGPQGTLYGRSAIGGTVNVTFRKPTKNYETTGLLEVGNYGLIHGTLTQNIPLSADLAIRLAGDYHFTSGYNATGSDAKNDYSLRASGLYKPGGDFSAYLWGYTTQKHGHPSNLVNKGYNPTTNQYEENAFLTARPWDDIRPANLVTLGVPPFLQPFVSNPSRSEQTYNNWVFGGQFDKGLGGNTQLSYIPGYFYLNSQTRNYWLGVIPAEISQHYKEVTQELRLSGKSDRFNWLLGLYAYRVVNGGDAKVFYNTGFQFYSSNVIRSRLQGAAVFGQGTYSISHALRITLGGRYGRDEREANGISLEDQVTPYTYKGTVNHFDYKAGAEYDLSPSAMIYATFQTGYQPKTYNQVVDLPGRPNGVSTATLSAISGGFKTRFFDNKLQINNEFFFYNYRNLFIQAYDVRKLNNPIINAPKVTIPGTQLDILFKPTANDQLNFSVSYAAARFKNFVSDTGPVPNWQPPYAADWTISGGAYHDFRFDSGYVRAQADARYESRFYADYVHNQGTSQAPATKANASITYYANSGRFSLGAWVRNIGNKATLAASAAAGFPGGATAYLEPPRTYGLRGTFKF